MKGKALRLVVGCLTVVLLVLAACAPAAPSPVPAPGPKPAPKPAPPEKEIVTPVAKEPQYGGTLTIITWLSVIEPQTWDYYDGNWIVNPYTCYYQENMLVGDLAKGPRGTNQWAFTDVEWIPDEFIRGDLAEKWEMPDSKTLIFRLRRGIRFYDKPGVMASREMTADDVLFSWKRVLASPKFRATGYAFLADIIESLAAPDKYTVIVKFKEFNAKSFTYLGMGIYFRVYPPELVKAGIHDWKNAVGTGPFMLKDYVSGASVVYERNPIYWGKTIINGKEYSYPFVDRLILPVITDESTQLAALRTAKCDIEESVSWKYKESLAQTNPQLLRWRVLSPSLPIIATRADRKPFDDIRVRRALNMAIDKRVILSSQYGGEGQLLSFPYSAAWPETLYTPLEKLPQSARELFEYNPQQAKQLLTEAGLPKGFKAELITTTEAAHIDLCSMVAAYWKDIGVEVELKPLEYATWTSTMYNKAHKHLILVAKGLGSPFGILVMVKPGAFWNPANVNDPHINEVIAKAEQTADLTEQYRILKELNTYIIDQAAYVILPVSYTYRYAWPWVKNYYGEHFVASYASSQVHATIWLDRELREKMIGKK